MEKPLTFNSVDIINGKFYKVTVIWSGKDRMSEQMLNQIKNDTYSAKNFKRD